MRVELSRSFLKAYKKRIQTNAKLDAQMATRIDLFRVITLPLACR